jgi:hypothetical protein
MECGGLFTLSLEGTPLLPSPTLGSVIPKGERLTIAGI